MTLRFDHAPAEVCLIRLSAIGDTCHAVAVLRALQKAWPETRFTWIIGKVEARLMSAVLPEIQFITFDKRAARSEMSRIRSELSGRSFDLLLHMQLSFRASLISMCVRAKTRLGFDRARARELQWLFTNARIRPRENEHVLDSLLGFVRACGIEPGPPCWNIRHSEAALEYAAGLIPDERPTLLISPCSSRALRNWSAAGYAAVARHAARARGMRVLLVGGPSPDEARMGAAIESAAQCEMVNQIGKDTLPLLLALIARARVLLTPDSGPAHMATMVGTTVIGLYAATNPARSGPYLSRATCIDRYDAAARRYLGKPADRIAWTAKIERPGVMDLIKVPDVVAMLDNVILNA
jgi:heptosyltransferase I